MTPTAPPPTTVPEADAAPAVDVCVRGGGIVGSALALSLAGRGFRVVLQGRPRAAKPLRDDGPHTDVRAYALNPSSVAFLQSLGVWSTLAEDARTAIHDMQVQGDLRRATLHFSAWQQKVAALGWIVDAEALEAALSSAVDDRCAAPGATLLRQGDEHAVVRASLLAVTEGGRSSSREALGVGFERQPYGQHAVAARIRSDRPHQNTAHQWFLSPDILALLPLDRPTHDLSYALVWSVSTSRAQALMAMDAAAFDHALNEAIQGHPTDRVRATGRGSDVDGVGRLALASERASWPLSVARADRITGPGWVLLGDAAHVIHPLAGQGLNLGLGDVQALVAAIDAKEAWRPIGDARLLSRYERRRSAAVGAMTFTTDTLQQLFAHPAVVARELRNAGLSLVEHLPYLKRRLARHALVS